MGDLRTVQIAAGVYRRAVKSMEKARSELDSHILKASENGVTYREMADLLSGAIDNPNRTPGFTDLRGIHNAIHRARLAE